MPITVRLPDMISRFKRLVNRKSPLRHLHMQKETTVALSITNKIGHQDLSKIQYY